MVVKGPGEQFHRLAETKFYPPIVHEDVVPRPRLLDRLQDIVVRYPLTLISAPAGYGKTTLLSAFSQTCSHPSLAWLSLDKEDNDPLRFLAAMITALQHLDPSSCKTALSLLANPLQFSTAIQRFMGVLINDMLDSFQEPFAFILDDLHLISEPSIYAALDYLLEHRPRQFHLVVSTRVDPPLALARLRARGDVIELRLNELRFSEEEVSAFFNDRLQLGLSESELSLLKARTEGWAVGLRLLATSLDRDDPASDRTFIIKHLAQSDRNIFEFLAEEVFNQQEKAVRDFLLETAIIPELTPWLCQAVTRRNDAASMLELLYRRNLFLVQVSPLIEQRVSSFGLSASDDSPFESPDPVAERKYRYHDLFAEYLRYKLIQERPDSLAILHLRAAKAERDPAKAVGHYLEASAWENAATLIEQIGADMFARGYLETLSRWINRLPPSVRDNHPRLLHYLSNCAFLNSSWSEVQSLLERALQGFEKVGDRAGQGEVLVNLATCAVGQGDLERGGDLYGEALNFAILPHTRIQALLGRALTGGALGNWTGAERDFRAAMDLFHPIGKLDPLYLMIFPYFHPTFALLPGGLEQLEGICRMARDQLGQEISPSRLMVEEMTATLQLYRGKLDQVIDTGQRALHLRKRLGGHPYLSLNAALCLLIAHAARGNFAGVEPLLDALFLGVDLTAQPPPDLPIYLFYIGRLRLLQGRQQEASDIYIQMRDLAEADQARKKIPEVRICLAWMQSLLASSKGRYEQAERILRQPEVFEQKDRSSTMNGSTRLMLARLYHQQDRCQEALLELEPVLTYYQQLGVPLAILVEGQSIVPLLRLAVAEKVQGDYAAYLLDILGTDDAAHSLDIPQTGEVLTPREVEVLRLVTAGYSNGQIAEQLVISKWTVKSHLTSSYRKLDVSSRTQAVARVRELGIG